MKLIQITSAILFAGLLLIALPGCEQQGPAERAGENIDNAVEEAGDKIEEAGDAIKDSAQGDNP